MILFLDPSSSRTGYAVFTDTETLVEAGSLKPHHRDDEPIVRIRTMAHDLRELVVEHEISLAVLENTSGHVGANHEGGGAGLAIYGIAIGYLWATLDVLLKGKVEAVLENEWTKGVPKEDRAITTKLLLPAVRNSTDLDALDACGLALWHFERQRVAAIVGVAETPAVEPARRAKRGTKVKSAA